MCGITGAIWTDPERAIDAPTLARMTDVLRHRGPDDRGAVPQRVSASARRTSRCPASRSGFRRLSIIDLAGGHQPMSNEDGIGLDRLQRRDLQLPRPAAPAGRLGPQVPHRQRHRDDRPPVRGRRASTASAHLERHVRGRHLGRATAGGSCSAAIGWARSRSSIAHEPGRLLFASELKSLLEVPGLPREIDPPAVDEYLTYQYVPHPSTIFRGFRKLPPGHYAVWQDGKLDVQPYWQPDFTVEQPISRSGRRPSELRELLDVGRASCGCGATCRWARFSPAASIRRSIVALMQQHSAEPVKTFSIGFPVPEYDESTYARRVAEHLQTEHHELQVEPDAVDDPAEAGLALRRAVRRQLGDSDLVRLAADARSTSPSPSPATAATSCSPAIRAIGPWRWPACSTACRRSRSLLAARAVADACRRPARQKSLLRQFKRFSEALALSPERRYLDWISIFNEAPPGRAVQRRFPRRSCPTRSGRRSCDPPGSAASGRDPVTAALAGRPGDVPAVRPDDQGRHRLDGPRPGVPRAVSRLSRGRIGRRAAGRLQASPRPRQADPAARPSATCCRGRSATRPKMGFGVPLDHWFRDELRELTHATCCSIGELALPRGSFGPRASQLLLDEHQRAPVRPQLPAVGAA